jgi:hypothetical protein
MPNKGKHLAWEVEWLGPQIIRILKDEPRTKAELEQCYVHEYQEEDVAHGRGGKWQLSEYFFLRGVNLDKVLAELEAEGAIKQHLGKWEVV